MSKATRSTPQSSPADYEHERLRGLLPEYAMSCLQQTPDQDAWQALSSHLIACADCRDELDDLLQLLDDTYAGTLPTDADMPEIDLSYLPPWFSPDEVGEQRAVVRRTVDAARRVLITFTDMLVEAMHRPHFAGGFRHGGEQRDPKGRVPAPPQRVGDSSLPNEFSYQVQGTPPDDLDVAIDLSLTDSHQALYRVRVLVVDPKDPFAQDNHSIILSYDAHSVEAVTDTHGCATFADIPYAALAQLQLTIRLHP